MDECCAICTESLEWTGYGPCGHFQTCSKCIACLRFVLKDKRCPICQQETETVFFTRYMGNSTKKLTSEQFNELQVQLHHTSGLKSESVGWESLSTSEDHQQVLR